MIIRITRAAAFSVAIACITLSVSALAQTAQPIEEIIVRGQQIGYYEKNATTALKQNVPLLETPASVFIINSELIADQQSFRLDQILQNDSSVQKSNNFLGAYSSYQVRGFGLQNGSNYLRDGRPFFQLASPPTEVLDQVEVLKGPASVLYGTLAPGGVVNLVSKTPTADTRGSLKVTGGSYDFQHIHLDVGGPIDKEGKFLYRFNAVSEDSENFRRFFNGDSFEIDRKIFALALAWNVSDQTQISVNMDNTNDDRPQDNGLIGENGEILDVLSYELIYNQPWTLYNSDVSNVLVKLNHNFNDQWNVKLGYSVQQFKRDRYDNQLRSFDADTGDNVIRARRRLNQREYATYFMDITGTFSTGNIRHNLLVGFDQTDIERRDKEVQNADRITFASNIFGAAFPDPNIEIGNRRVEGVEDRSGFYIQDMIELGDKWRVLLGGRYDDFSTTISGDYSITNFTPRAGLLYLAKPNLSFYASASESFEPNGPVGGGFANEGEQLDPTVGQMFEAGFKWEAFAGNVLFAGAIFAIERDGDAIEDLPSNTILQRGLQEHTGAEFSASGLVGNNLSVVGSVTYLDAQFTRDENPDIIGNSPVGVAELSLSLWAEYQVEQDVLAGLSLQGGVFYESDRPVDDDNSFDLDAYVRVDVGAKYTLDLDNGNAIISRITLSNAFDKQYFKARTRFAINPERPRELRASVQYMF
ncbi:MAG: iron complex outermembrane receptor protein [Pseudohongiellaceae bacterium]|jgi:iron complex outermembrane receptor protein